MGFATNEVSKTPTAKNSTIVMEANKQFMVDYILKSPLYGEKNHLHEALLEVVMNKFSILVGSKWFIWSGMGSMDNIMASKDHLGFKYVYDSRFSWQYKDKVLVFKMYVDFVGSGVNTSRRMQCGWHGEF